MVLGKFSDGASEPTVLALVAGGELGCFFFFLITLSPRDSRTILKYSLERPLKVGRKTLRN